MIKLFFLCGPGNVVQAGIIIRLNIYNKPRLQHNSVQSKDFQLILALIIYILAFQMVFPYPSIKYPYVTWFKSGNIRILLHFK